MTFFARSELLVKTDLICALGKVGSLHAVLVPDAMFVSLAPPIYLMDSAAYMNRTCSEGKYYHEEAAGASRRSHAFAVRQDAVAHHGIGLSLAATHHR